MGLNKQCFDWMAAHLLALIFQQIIGYCDTLWAEGYSLRSGPVWYDFVMVPGQFSKLTVQVYYDSTGIYC